MAKKTSKNRQEKYKAQYAITDINLARKGKTNKKKKKIK